MTKADQGAKFEKDARRNYVPSARERDEAAERYALADKSDPFVRNRIRTHMNNGICGFTQNGGEAFYTADEVMETRGLEKVDNLGQTYIEEYQVPTYRNRARP